MAATTAHILIGRAHPNDGGLVTGYRIELSEGSRPAWTLTKGARRIVWIPTLEHTLEDALLMAALHVVESDAVRALFGQFSDKADGNRVEMYDDLTADQREQLYQCCRALTIYPKFILCIFDDSLIMSQIEAMEAYQMECEVLIPVYSRTYSRWARETTVKGSLRI